MQANIESYTIWYVDDSTNKPSSHNIIKLECYVNDYFNATDQYYNLDKLTLNHEKSKFMIVCTASMREKC